MPTTYTFQSGDVTLIVNIQTTEGFTTSLAYSLIAGITSFASLKIFSPIPLLLLLAASLVMSVAALYLRRLPKRARMVATENEFSTHAFVGRLPRRLKKQVCAADISWLEHRPDVAGADIVEPGGLYAIMPTRSVCLLPDLNEEETREVITAVEAKFPQLAQNWRSRSYFGSASGTLI
jgi:hypothetical protein